MKSEPPVRKGYLSFCYQNSVENVRRYVGFELLNTEYALLTYNINIDVYNSWLNGRWYIVNAVQLLSSWLGEAIDCTPRCAGQSTSSQSIYNLHNTSIFNAWLLQSHTHL